MLRIMFSSWVCAVCLCVFSVQGAEPRFGVETGIALPELGMDPVRAPRFITGQHNVDEQEVIAQLNTRQRIANRLSLESGHTRIGVLRYWDMDRAGSRYGFGVQTRFNQREYHAVLNSRGLSITHEGHRYVTSFGIKRDERFEDGGYAYFSIGTGWE